MKTTAEEPATVAAKDMEAALSPKDMEAALSPPPSPPEQGSDGQWSSGCCGCCEDMCTCCAVCWLPCFPLGSLCSRVNKSEKHYGQVVTGLMLLYIVYYILGQVNNTMLQAAAPTADDYWSGGGYSYELSAGNYIVSTLYGLASLAVCLTTCMISMKIRNAIKLRDGIIEDDFTTCCMSCCPCTSSCALCQMMRHEGLNGQNYQLCKPYGTSMNPPGRWKGDTEGMMTAVPMPVATAVAQPVVAQPVVAQPITKMSEPAI